MLVIETEHRLIHAFESIESHRLLAAADVGSRTLVRLAAFALVDPSRRRALPR
jgi:hypothetical protein